MEEENTQGTLTPQEIEKLQSLSQQIEYVGIETIHLSPNKARKIRNAIPKVAASIRMLGFRSPIYVDGNAGDEIIAGHTRYCAAKLLGLTKVPIVRVTDLKPSLVKFLRLADNRVAEFTSWNFEELNKTLASLRDTMPEVDFEGLGFVKTQDIDLDGVDDLDDANYDEPNERNLKCPSCGYEGSSSFFQKEESEEEEAKEEEEKKQEEPTQEAEQKPPQVKHEDEDIEEVLKSVASQVQALDGESVGKLQALVQKIEYVDIDTVIPSENKERNVEKGVERVASVIRKVGFRNPIYVTQGREIICGHTRYLAAKSLGMTKVPIVVVSDLTQAEMTLLRLADNRVAEFSSWEFYQLNREIDELKVELPESIEETGLFEKDLLLWDAESHSSSGGGSAEEKILICPKCGHKAGASAFQK